MKIMMIYDDYIGVLMQVAEAPAKQAHWKTYYLCAHLSLDSMTGRLSLQALHVAQSYRKSHSLDKTSINDLMEEGKDGIIPVAAIVKIMQAIQEVEPFSWLSLARLRVPTN